MYYELACITPINVLPAFICLTVIWIPSLIWEFTIFDLFESKQIFQKVHFCVQWPFFTISKPDWMFQKPKYKQTTQQLSVTGQNDHFQTGNQTRSRCFRLTREKRSFKVKYEAWRWDVQRSSSSSVFVSHV